MLCVVPMLIGGLIRAWNPTFVANLGLQAQPGAVTGNATYGSFVSSMCRAKGQGAGLHFC